MALSQDPEKRARSLANLRHGAPAAAKKFGLDVVGYDEPDPALGSPPPKATPKARKPKRPAAATPDPEAREAVEPSGGSSALLMLGGGLALLVVLVLILNHTGGPRDGR